jgi:hypothetical protein
MIRDELLTVGRNLAFIAAAFVFFGYVIRGVGLVIDGILWAIAVALLVWHRRNLRDQV